MPDNKTFPALMITTGDHDDRVVPLHSFKYLAEVQYKGEARYNIPKTYFILLEIFFYFLFLLMDY